MSDPKTPWARISVDFLEHPKLILLPAEDQIDYLKMLLHSVKFATDGEISIEEMAIKFGYRQSKMQRKFDRFEAANLLEKKDTAEIRKRYGKDTEKIRERYDGDTDQKTERYDGDTNSNSVYYLHGFHEWQETKESREARRQANKEKVKRWREKKNDDPRNQLRTGYRNRLRTGNDTGTDTDTDTDSLLTERESVLRTDKRDSDSGPLGGQSSPPILEKDAGLDLWEWAESTGQDIPPFLEKVMKGIQRDG